MCFDAFMKSYLLLSKNEERHLGKFGERFLILMAHLSPKIVCTPIQCKSNALLNVEDGNAKLSLAAADKQR